MAVAGTLCLVLSSCGSDGPQLPSGTPTRTSLPSPTVTLPSPTRSPSGPASETPAPSETAAPPTNSATPTPKPTPTETQTQTETATETATVTLTPSSSPSEAPSEAPTATESAAADDAADTSTTQPAWERWLVGLGVLAAAAVVLLLLRARRRRAWVADLGTATTEVEWFARVFLPQLQTADTADRVAGGWTVGMGRVAAVEDRLTALEATAANDSRRSQATTLRDAVRVARADMDRLVAPQSPTPLYPDLPGTMAGIIARLEAALTAAGA